MESLVLTSEIGPKLLETLKTETIFLYDYGIKLQNLDSGSARKGHGGVGTWTAPSSIMETVLMEGLNNGSSCTHQIATFNNISSFPRSLLASSSFSTSFSAMPSLILHLNFNRSSASDDLQQHDSKTVNIYLHCERRVLEPLWCNIPFSPSDAGQCFGVVDQELCQPKVRYFGGERIIQEYVLRLDVAMDDLYAAFFMQKKMREIAAKEKKLKTAEVPKRTPRIKIT
ncbi:hypothetical protein QQP08_022239 [Theobroma cacao]|nr:hypothetical protein QQP08_022239 [Theobroma cacao]